MELGGDLDIYDVEDKRGDIWIRYEIYIRGESSLGIPMPKPIAGGGATPTPTPLQWAAGPVEAGIPLPAN